MITEDYCSYEVAKLLKEKGFDEGCLHYYRVETTLKKEYIYLSFTEEYLHNSEIKYGTYKGCKCTAPTHQMAMKWLREVYDLPINVWYDKEEDILNNEVWNSEIAIGNPYTIVGSFASYEEAVEAALKYSLKHLI